MIRHPHPRRRTVAALAVAFVTVLAACGSDDTSSSATDAPAEGSVAASVAATIAVDDSAAPGTAATDEIPEGRGIVTENADGTRTVVSAWGEAMVPAEPQRIVSVIGDIDFEAMLALGVTPVGAGTQGGSASSGFSPHIDPALTADVEPLAWSDGAPYEAIAALQPDLIFAPNEETYELLSEIAPTVPRGSWVGDEWKDDFVYIGEVLGLADEAEAMIGAYDERATEMAGRLAESVGDELTVASPQVAYDASGVYVDGPITFSTAVLTELGLTLAPIVYEGDEWSTEVSYERLPEIDADILFWQVRQDDNGDPDTAALSNVEDNPLWPELPAVQADQVHYVENRPWYFPTILGAQRILDDVEAALLGN